MCAIMQALYRGQLHYHGYYTHSPHKGYTMDAVRVPIVTLHTITRCKLNHHNVHVLIPECSFRLLLDPATSTSSPQIDA